MPHSSFAVQLPMAPLYMPRLLFVPSARPQSLTVNVKPGRVGETCNCGAENGSFQATLPATPAPQIIFNGRDISGTTQNVLAGQQISVSVAAPPGYNIENVSWSLSNPAAISGGFTNTAGTGPPSAKRGGLEAVDPSLNRTSLTFYWVTQKTSVKA